MAALIAGGETEKSPAICGKDVEMIDESSPSMKNAPATTKGTIKGSFAGGGGSSLVTSVSATIQREFRISRDTTIAIALVYGDNAAWRQDEQPRHYRVSMSTIEARATIVSLRPYAAV